MVLRWCSLRAALSISSLFFFKEKNTGTSIHFPNSLSRCFLFVWLFFFLQILSPVPCSRQTRSIDAALLTWCYPSRWCEKASPVLPRSACHQKRKPETHPETACRHLQRHTEEQQAQNVALFSAERFYVT